MLLRDLNPGPPTSTVPHTHVYAGSPPQTISWFLETKTRFPDPCNLQNTHRGVRARHATSCTIYHDLMSPILPFLTRTPHCNSTSAQALQSHFNLSHWLTTRPRRPDLLQHTCACCVIYPHTHVCVDVKRARSFSKNKIS